MVSLKFQLLYVFPYLRRENPRPSVITYEKINFRARYLLKEGYFEYDHRNKKFFVESNETFLFGNFFDFLTLKFLQ